MLLLILLNPSREEHTTRPGPQPTAVFLIDESRSMSLESPRSRSRSGPAVDQERRGFGAAWQGGPPSRSTASAVSSLPFRRLRKRSPVWPTSRGWGVRSSSFRRGSARRCRLVCLSSRMVASTETEPLARRRGLFTSWEFRCTSCRWVTSGSRVTSPSPTSTRPVMPGRARACPVRVTVRSRGHAGERTELKHPAGQRRKPRCPGDSSDHPG